MIASSNDRNKVYSLVRQSRGLSSTTDTVELITPVGTYRDTGVLEGFAADAEYLGRAEGECPEYDNDFYRLCKMDNHYIFEIKPNEDCVKIPPLTIDTLNKIIHTKMELGKAADIYHLTTEHLRYCGPVAKTALLNLINSILEEIYYLSCPQIKRGLGTAIYKGKNKPRNISSS